MSLKKKYTWTKKKTRKMKHYVWRLGWNTHNATMILDCNEKTKIAEKTFHIFYELIFKMIPDRHLAPYWPNFGAQVAAMLATFFFEQKERPKFSLFILLLRWRYSSIFFVILTPSWRHVETPGHHNDTILEIFGSMFASVSRYAEP